MTLFAPPDQIQLHYRIVTPMFLGGENQQADATHFRNASYKGALRFWWRALNWEAAFKESQNQQDAALQWLHKKEGELFGLASDGKDSKQSLVQIHSTIKVKKLGIDLTSIAYLLGQGLYDHKKGITRSFLESGDLNITLRFKPRTSIEDMESIKKAAIALGLFGGLGSRSRRGLGSLSLESLKKNEEKEEKFDTIEKIKEFIKGINFSSHDNAPLSAFTEASRIDISSTANSAIQALQAIANEMQMYRSFGRKGKVNGQDSRFNFKDDHDKVLAASKGTPLQEPPQRAVFGLPHNYFFSSTNGKVDISAENEGRRASPLLVHVHALQDARFVAIQTFLPGLFLPQNMPIEVKSHKKTTLHNTHVDFHVITRYLDGFPKKEILKDPHHD